MMPEDMVVDSAGVPMETIRKAVGFLTNKLSPADLAEFLLILRGNGGAINRQTVSGLQSGRPTHAGEPGEGHSHCGFPRTEATWCLCLHEINRTSPAGVPIVRGSPT